MRKFKLPFGWCLTKGELRMPITMIVAPNAKVARRVHWQVSDPVNNTRVVIPRIHNILAARRPIRIIVLPGVDLNMQLMGGGDGWSLEAVLRSRQCSWGDRAEFIVL